MKTTVELPDDLMRAVKIRAVNEDRRLKDVMEDLIRAGLAKGPRPEGAAGRKVALPLVECAHPAHPEEEMTPERVAEVLVRDEAAVVR